MFRAAGYERTSLAVAPRVRPGVVGELEHERDPFGDPGVRFGAVGLEVGRVVRSALLDHVDRDDVELHRRPLLGADERDPHVDLVEELGVAPGADENLPQLSPAVVELGGDAEIRRELDAEVGEGRAIPELGDPGVVAAERVEVTPGRSVIQRLLFGLEVVGLDERLRAGESGLGLREARIGLDAVRHREAHVAGPVRVPLAAVHLAREAPAAQLLGEPEMARADVRRLLGLAGS